MRTDLVLDRRRQEREQRLALARDFARELTLPGVSAVVVFGSVAHGDFNLWSDVDVLVIAEGLPHGLLARAEQLGSPPPGVQASHRVDNAGQPLVCPRARHPVPGSDRGRASRPPARGAGRRLLIFNEGYTARATS